MKVLKVQQLTLGLFKNSCQSGKITNTKGHRDEDRNKNRKNGYATKTMKSEHGEFELDVPRDRNNSFEPEIVKKNQRTMTGEIEEKIPALYSHGNSYSQIVEMIEDIYGVGFSKGAISAVTDKIIPIVKRSLKLSR